MTLKRRGAKNQNAPDASGEARLALAGYDRRQARPAGTTGKTHRWTRANSDQLRP